MASSRKRPYEAPNTGIFKSRSPQDNATPSPVPMNGGNVADDQVDELWDEDDELTAHQFDILESIATQVVNAGNTNASQALPPVPNGVIFRGADSKSDFNAYHAASNLDSLRQQELEKVRHLLTVKDGEISVLRDSLNKCNTQLMKLKDEKIKRIDTESRERKEREQSLKTELNSLRTQLQFKNKELDEANSRVKRLQDNSVKQAVLPSSTVAPDQMSVTAAYNRERLPQQTGQPTFDTFRFTPTQSQRQVADSSSRSIEVQVNLSSSLHDTTPPSCDGHSYQGKIRNRFKIRSAIASPGGSVSGSEVVCQLLECSSSTPDRSPLAALLQQQQGHLVSGTTGKQCSTDSSDKRDRDRLDAMQAIRLLVSDGGKAEATSRERGNLELLPDCRNRALLRLIPLISDSAARFMRSESASQAQTKVRASPTTEQQTNVSDVGDVASSLHALLVLVQSSSAVREEMLTQHQVKQREQQMEQDGSSADNGDIICQLLYILRSHAAKASTTSDTLKLLVTIFDILITCCHVQDVTLLSSLSTIFSSDTLVPYLTPAALAADVPLVLSNKALQLMWLLSCNDHIFNIITRHADPCLLSHIYTVAARTLHDTDTHNLHTAEHMMSFLNTGISYHADGMENLLPNHCHCSDQCVKSVVEILWFWVSTHTSGGSCSPNLSLHAITPLLLMGLTFLYHVSKRESDGSAAAAAGHRWYPHEAKYEYVKLVTTVSRLTNSQHWDASQFDVEPILQQLCGAAGGDEFDGSDTQQLSDSLENNSSSEPQQVDGMLVDSGE